MTSTPPDRHDPVALLRCPACRECLRRPAEARADDGELPRLRGALRCENGHSFDVARQGHLTLLDGAGARGLRADTVEMVAARSAVQDAGFFAPVADALARSAEEVDLPEGGLLDLGGGTGYYAAHLLEALPNRVGVSIDLSSVAARRAARAHPRLISVVADVWRELPINDAAAALVTCVFAPRNAGEIARVLAPGGLLLVVTPRPGHLRELVEGAGMLAVDADKEQRLAEQLAAFDPVAERTITCTREVTPTLAADLVLMGPSAFHVDPDDLRSRLADHAPPTVTLDVRMGAYRRPQEPR